MMFMSMKCNILCNSFQANIIYVVNDVLKLFIDNAALAKKLNEDCENCANVSLLQCNLYILILSNIN